MKHIELLKLAAGADAVAVQEKLYKTYQKLDDELDWMNHPVVVRGCGHSDADLMVSVELEGEEQLEDFLAQPRLKKLTDALGDAVEAKFTFDHY